MSAGKPRFTKKRWIAVAASAAVVIAAAIAVPLASSNAAYASAVDELHQSEAQLEDAHTALVSATDELADAGTEARDVYAASGEFASVVRPELLADPSMADDFTVARASLAETAGIAASEGDADTELPASLKKAASPKKAATPKTVEEILEQAKANRKLAARYAKDADSLREKVTAISTQSKNISALTEDVVSSGAEFGANSKGLDKAGAATQKGLRTALDALSDTKSPAKERLAAYAAAYDALRKSHTDAAAAEIAARQQAEIDAQKKSNPGTSNGNQGGTKHSNGGSTSKPGSAPKPENGGNGTKPSQPAPAPAPAPAPKPAPAPAPKVPAKFATGKGYIPFAQCDGFFYSSHQVGWGGTSTGGNSLASRGKWSATANGDTVTYYLCL